MLSRITREKLGTAVILIGILWLMAVAGGDDYNTLHHVATPLIYLIGKTAIGFIIIGVGAKISKGGSR